MWTLSTAVEENLLPLAHIYIIQQVHIKRTPLYCNIAQELTAQERKLNALKQVVWSSVGDLYFTDV
jgi:hypothetical protein